MLIMLLARVNNSDVKTQEAVLLAMAALAKENGPVAVGLGRGLGLGPDGAFLRFRQQAISPALFNYEPSFPPLSSAFSPTVQSLINYILFHSSRCLPTGARPQLHEIEERRCPTCRVFMVRSSLVHPSLHPNTCSFPSSSVMFSATHIIRGVSSTHLPPPSSSNPHTSVTYAQSLYATIPLDDACIRAVINMVNRVVGAEGLGDVERRVKACFVLCE